MSLLELFGYLATTANQIPVVHFLTPRNDRFPGLFVLEMEVVRDTLAASNEKLDK